MDDVVACSLYSSRGPIVRLGGDERDPDFIPIDFNCATQIPGGYDTASFLLARADLRSEDIELLARLRAYGPGGQTVYEGRVNSTPRAVGSGVTVNLEGRYNVLEDDKTIRRVYVDADPSSWREPTLNLRAAILVADQPLDADYHATTHQQSLGFVGSTDKKIRSGSQACLMYVMPGGLRAAQICYSGVEDHVANEDPPTLYGTNDDTDGMGSWPDSHILVLDGADNLRRPTLDSPRKFLGLRIKSASDHGDGSSPANAAHRTFHRIAVYGDHGLALVADPDGLVPDGVLGSDVVADVLPESLTDGAEIEASTFPIPHLVFFDPTTRRAILEEATNYGGAAGYINDWGVYETFFWKAPGTYGTTWYVERATGWQPSDEGRDASDARNGVLVTYADRGGTAFSVGPPGSDADYETAELLDTDPANPANGDGERHWETIDVGTSTQDGAVSAGIGYILELRERWSRGSLVGSGDIYDAAGMPHPNWEARAGDRFVVSDDEDTSERRVISTTYTRKDRQLSAQIGAPPHRLDVAIKRAQALAGVGG